MNDTPDLDDVEAHRNLLADLQATLGPVLAASGEQIRTALADAALHLKTTTLVGHLLAGRDALATEHAERFTPDEAVTARDVLDRAASLLMLPDPQAEQAAEQFMNSDDGKATLHELSIVSLFRHAYVDRLGQPHVLATIRALDTDEIAKLSLAAGRLMGYLLAASETRRGKDPEQ